MNKFLTKLRKDERLELVEPSEAICESYIIKADNCLRSAKLLIENNLFENSVSMSYYTMYNSLTAFLFKIGIKCENHGGSILLLKLLLNQNDLFKIISDAKEERIDKQYYVITEKDNLTKEITSELLANAEIFLVKSKVIINELNNDSINQFREKLRKLIEK